MQVYPEAYLDIETTGLSPAYSEITVAGVYLVDGTEARFLQLTGGDITADNLLEAVEGVRVMYMYNGSRFDLPFINSRLGINLATLCEHHDLMYDCWRQGLKGGLKCVEEQLVIPRCLKGISGYEAVWLWWRYVNDYDQDALNTLLEYNKEDAINLKTLKERLGCDRSISSLQEGY